MFGIAGAENTSGESADVPGDMSEMPSICEKRPRSSGCYTPPPAKRKKHDDSTPDKDDKVTLEPIDIPPQDLLPRIMRSNGIKLNDSMTTIVPESQTNTTTETNLDDSITEDSQCFELKELRVVLRDIRTTDWRFNGNSEFTNDPKLFEVERILGKRMKRGVALYFIKWKNWTSECNTWEPVENLVNCTEMLNVFEEEHVQLIEDFKRQANFDPETSDAEIHMRELIKRNQPINGNFEEEQEDLYRSLKSFFNPRTLEKNREKIARSIKRGIIKTLFRDLRRDQLDSLQDWEAEMNSITQGKPSIKVENLADLESAPQDFLYIEEYLPGSGVMIPDEPPIGCECKNCDSKSKCCFAQYDGVFPYTSAGRVRVPPGTPIYECNKRCTCPVDCKNRVVQRGAGVGLCVFRTTNGRGWGVKTLKLIKKGTFVTQYVGEVITNEEAEKRGKEYDAAGRTYLFDLDYNVTEYEETCPYTVDAAVYGNVSHFINHSCDPNCAVYGVWIDCLDPNLPKLALFATRDIRKDEEITFDYMRQSSRTYDRIKDSTNTGESRQRLELPHEIRNDKPLENKTRCQCGAKQCRQYLF